MNERTKIVIVCSPNLDADFALEYSRKNGYFVGTLPHVSHAIPTLEGKLDFYFFPEADMGYRTYRDHVSKRIVEAVEKKTEVLLIHTRYLEPAVNGFVEVALLDSSYSRREFPKVVEHDQIEVHLWRPEDSRWTIHGMTDDLHMDNHWPIGYFWG